VDWMFVIFVAVTVVMVAEALGMSFIRRLNGASRKERAMSRVLCRGRMAPGGREDSMSQRDVERTLGRLLTDESFQEDFFRDPARACLLLGIQLARQEVEALLRAPRSALASLGARLDNRICRLQIQRGEIARQGE